MVKDLGVEPQRTFFRVFKEFQGSWVPDPCRGVWVTGALPSSTKNITYIGKYFEKLLSSSQGCKEAKGGARIRGVWNSHISGPDIYFSGPEIPVKSPQIACLNYNYKSSREN